MGMPRDFVLVRHGESEANVVQHLSKHGGTHPRIKEVYGRPDWEQRLSLAGIEQARKAGRWVAKELGGVAMFDLRLRSPFLRTRETSLYLTSPDLDITDHHAVAAVDETWENDLRLVERHWGMYGTMTLKQQKKIYPHT